jgi:hypothetical protein
MSVEKEWPLECTICGKAIPGDGPCSDSAHVVNEVSDEQYAKLWALWGVDPYADLIVCDACMTTGKAWGAGREAAS